MFASLCVYHVLLEGFHELLDDIPSIHMNTQTHKHWMEPRAVWRSGNFVAEALNENSQETTTAFRSAS